MKINDIAKIINEMKGRMPESSRATLAHKFINLFGKGLTTAKGDAILQQWVDNGGVARFLHDCELLSKQPFCSHEIAVHDTDLATFINRWMNIDEFKRGPGEDFEPITPDMHAIRSMMVDELKQLYERQKRETDDGNNIRNNLEADE